MSTYVGNMDNLEVDSGYFYINPFHGAVSSSDNAEYLTKVDGYDGRTIVEVSANTNSFNVRTEGNSTSASFINGKMMQVFEETTAQIIPLVDLMITPMLLWQAIQQSRAVIPVTLKTLSQ